MSFIATIGLSSIFSFHHLGGGSVEPYIERWIFARILSGYFKYGIKITISSDFLPGLSLFVAFSFFWVCWYFLMLGKNPDLVNGLIKTFFICVSDSYKRSNS